MEQIADSSKDKVIFFDKSIAKEPLSLNSKYIEHMAENDPSQPGTFEQIIWYFFLE
jgi:hypothetical protein